VVAATLLAATVAARKRLQEQLLLQAAMAPVQLLAAQVLLVPLKLTCEPCLTA
jgi:hypothetical protein